MTAQTQTTAPVQSTVSVVDKSLLIKTMAVKLAVVAEAEALAVDSRTDLNALLADAKKAGLTFMLQSRDGKAKADACPNRKALKTALQARFTESRARDLTAFLVLYYESNTAVASLRNYDAVYHELGKAKLAKLAINIDKADNKTAKKPVVQHDTKAAPTTKAAKAVANKLVEKQGIEDAFAVFAAHPEFDMFTRWVSLTPAKRGDSFPAWVKTQKENSKLEAEKAAWLAQAEKFGFALK